MRGGESMKPIKFLYVLILVIIVAAAGFYGGMWYQKNQTQASFARGADGQFGFRRFGGNGMMPVRGQVVNTGNNSVTVKLNDGSSKIVDLTAQTTINKTTTGSASDLKSGQEVTAIGMSNSDGSITAQTVLVGNGMMMFRRGGNQPGPTGQ